MILLQGEFSFLTEKNHIISIVGAGGKTTLMYALAKRFAQQGMKTLVSTTTHIYRPEEGLWAKSPEEARRLWEEGSYAVAGLPAENGKLKSLPEQELRRWAERAEAVLLEADGAKRLPGKVPAAHEPVILPESDIVIAVMGMKAWGRPIGEVCFRPEEAEALLEAGPEELMTKERMARILSSEKGSRKGVDGRDYYVVLNQCDTQKEQDAARQIAQLLYQRGAVKCVLTTSGENL